MTAQAHPKPKKREKTRQPLRAKRWGVSRSKRGTKHRRRPREWGRMAFVRSLPCILRAYACRGPVQAHHAGQPAVGRRPPDDTCIPLCDGHHDAYHDGGEPFTSWGRFSRRQWADLEIRKARAAWDALLPSQQIGWDMLAQR